MSTDVMNASAPVDGQSNQLTGTDSQPAPVNESNGRYSRYYDLNKEEPAAGTAAPKDENRTPEDPGEKPVERSANAKESPTDAKPAAQRPGKIPDWQRRINVLTARDKSRESEMQELRRQLEEYRGERAEGQREQPKKLSRDNFLSDAEYLEHLAEVKAEEKLNSKLQTLQKEARDSSNSEREHQAFRQSWVQKVQGNFPREEDRQEFAELLRGAQDNLHQDIHDFMQNSDVGPRMLRLFRIRPDFTESLNRMPASVRATRLAQVETALFNELQQEYAAAAAAMVETPSQGTPAPSRQAAPQQKVSKAPAPIGPVGNSGISATADDLNDADAVRAYKRKKFGA